VTGNGTINFNIRDTISYISYQSVVTMSISCTISMIKAATHTSELVGN